MECSFPKWSLSAIFWAIRGAVAAGAVVDNEVHLDLVFYSLVYDLNGISIISRSNTKVSIFHYVPSSRTCVPVPALPLEA